MGEVSFNVPLFPTRQILTRVVWTSPPQQTRVLTHWSPEAPAQRRARFCPVSASFFGPEASPTVEELWIAPCAGPQGPAEASPAPPAWSPGSRLQFPRLPPNPRARTLPGLPQARLALRRPALPLHGRRLRGFRGATRGRPGQGRRGPGAPWPAALRAFVRAASPGRREPLGSPPRALPSGPRRLRPGRRAASPLASRARGPFLCSGLRRDRLQ